MKIIILTDDFPPHSFGGAGIIAFEQAKGLLKIGHEIVVVTTTRDKEKERMIVYEGLKIYSLYSKYHERWQAYISLYNPMVIKKVREIFIKERADIVHAHNVHYHLSYYSLLLARNYAEKVFLTAHDAMLVSYGKIFPKTNPINGRFDYKISLWEQVFTYKLRYNPLRNIIIKYFIRNLSRILVVSESLMNALGQNGISNMQVLYNGINLDIFKSDDEKNKLFLDKYNLGSSKIMVVAGRMSSAKGGGIALDVLKSISQSISDVRLLIVGQKSDYIKKLLLKAEEQGVADKVILSGWLSREQMPVMYASADVVLVLSTCLDSFPTVNLEAMAMKKPVIGTCFGGTPEAVIHKQTGYIVNPYDLNVIVKYVEKLFTQPKLANDLGIKGYDRVKSFLSIDINIDKLNKLYYEKNLYFKSH